MGVVYLLRHNETPIYVGKTSRALEMKIGEHYEQSRQFLAGLIADEQVLAINEYFTPEVAANTTIEILEECGDSEVLNTAKFDWITELASPQLLNIRGNPYRQEAKGKPTILKTPRVKKPPSPLIGIPLAERNKILAEKNNWERGRKKTWEAFSIIPGEEWEVRELYALTGRSESAAANLITRFVKYKFVSRIKRGQYKKIVFSYDDLPPYHKTNEQLIAEYYNK